MTKNKLTFYNEELKRVGFFPNSVNEIKEYFKKNNDATLIVDFDDLWCYHNDFKDFSIINQIDIRKLLIQGTHIEGSDTKSFLEIENLIELDNRYVFDYDFKKFPNLETLRYSWNKNSTNLSECQKLKELSLWQYKPKNQNLTEFSKLNSLKELRIIQSNINSISGIENLQKITEMCFIGNRNLSFDNINTIFSNVETLYIESCKEIRIEKVIELFPNLKDLNFFSNNEILSLRIILDNLKKLEKLNVYNLKISETDNRYWKEYKNLKQFNFQDRKHHILKRKDFENI